MWWRVGWDVWVQMIAWIEASLCPHHTAECSPDDDGGDDAEAQSEKSLIPLSFILSQGKCLTCQCKENRCMCFQLLGLPLCYKPNLARVLNCYGCQWLPIFPTFRIDFELLFQQYSTNAGLILHTSNKAFSSSYPSFNLGGVRQKQNAPEAKTPAGIPEHTLSRTESPPLFLVKASAIALSPSSRRFDQLTFHSARFRGM